MAVSDVRTAERIVGRWLKLREPRLVPATGGHINASFLVVEGGSAPGWLLQHINRHVFPAPEQVLRNIEVVLSCAAAAPGTGVTLPMLLRTTSGETWATDEAGELWRCWVVKPGVRSSSRVSSAIDARRSSTSATWSARA